MSPLEVRVLPIDALKPAAYNPRKASAPAYRRLKASLTAFGLVEPLVWNERTGHVVGGHLRLRALKELGYAEVPVSVVRLDDAGEKALNVVLNNLEAQGRYDPAKLADLLADLEHLPELAQTGFGERTLTTLRLDPPAEPRTAGAAPDRVEITLVTDAATYDELAPGLDELVGRYDLVAHVRRG
ncbi:MAG: ParB N-terminal domain-containing protein [Gemmataceae bacterium]|nr:ParB N-terminal domain-containing protein [Gemmataceae bacterium]